MSGIRFQRQLLRAAESGNCHRVRELLAAGADVNQPTQDPDGETPLIRAIASGQLEIVQLLLQAGADVNLPQKGAKCWTPLMFAHDQSAIAGELIAAGADVNARTPVRIVSGSLHLKNPRLGSETTLHLAAAANNVEVIKQLILAGAEIEARTADGFAPLDIAIRAGTITPAAEVLVTAGAELTPQRLETMHASAHSVDSDLLHFPWGFPADAEANNAPLSQEVEKNERSGLPTPSADKAGYGEFKCPQCQSLLYSRKSKICGICGAALPAELLLNEQQVQALEAERQWARNLADKFGASRPSSESAGQKKTIANIQKKGEAVRFAPDELLRGLDWTQEFRNRPRPHFGLYLIGYSVLFFPVALIAESAVGIPAMAWLPLVGMIALLCWRAWHCARPVCPNCQQNIRTCPAAFCLSCGSPLRSRRCEGCVVDHSWIVFLSQSKNQLNFRWIDYCPSCGVRLDTKVRRWGAWGRM